MFISVILSAAPPRHFQTETLEREVEGPRGAFFLFILHQGVLTIPLLLLGTIHYHGFLKLSFCATVKLFLKHHTSTSAWFARLHQIYPAISVTADVVSFE
jgi:hypothetical protein